MQAVIKKKMLTSQLQALPCIKKRMQIVAHMQMHIYICFDQKETQNKPDRQQHQKRH